MQRWLARLLVCSLVITAPGLDVYKAFGQTVSGVPTDVAAPRVQAGPAGTSAGGALSGPASLSLHASLAPSLAGPSLSPRVVVGAKLAAAPAPQAPLKDDKAVLVEAVKQTAVFADPKASEGSAKSDAGRSFEGPSKSAAGAVAADGAFSSAPSGLAPAQVSQGFGRGTVPAAAPVLKEAKTFKDKFREALPRLALIGGAAALAYFITPWAAGFALPVVFGMISGDNGGEVGPRLIERFRQELSAAVRPGERVTAAAVRDASDRVGADPSMIDGVLAALVREGSLLKLPNGMLIFTQVGRRARDGNVEPFDLSANVEAAQALALANGQFTGRSSMREHAEALRSFNEVLDLYSGYRKRTGRSHPDRAEIETLRDNAALAVLNDVIELYGQQLAAKDGAESAEKLRFVEKVKAWLKAAYFSTDHEPSDFPEDQKAFLTGFLSELAAGAARHQGPEDRALAAGLRQARDFFAFTSETPKAAGGAFAKAEGFPLIDKKDSRYEALNQYGENLSRKAVEGKLPPLIGRRKEIRQMVKTLLRVEKNNPILTGLKGVGKTAVAAGLAQLIVQGKIPELAGKNIIKLDLTKIVAGTKYRGEFEERMHKIISELKASKGQVILFIDEIHTILGLGDAEGAQDAAGILKEALSGGEVSIIGATTMKEYRAIEKDDALARRFNEVRLNPPTKEEGIEIVMGVKARYEKKHGVAIGEETVKAAVAQAARYITDRNLPDSALDLLDDASAEVELKANEAKEAGKPAATEVTPEDIAFEIHLRTGIPAHSVGADDLASLKTLPSDLKAKVIGQDHAIDAVVRAIQRGRLGYKNQKQPIGVFLMLGPTGVGKTETARALALNQFQDENAIVRVDGADYMEEHAVSKLIGPPPGYVGYDGESQLTEPVRRKKHAVVLFDEIDKAHPKALDIFLQIIEDGWCKDSQGRVIDFSNTIIILTSNFGGSIAKGLTPEDYIRALKAKVRPEFYNRIGRRRVIVYNSLKREDYEKIVELQLAALNVRLKDKKMAVTLTDAAKGRLIDDASSAENSQYGARPLKQAVEEEIETALVNAELAGKIKNGDRVTVDHDGKDWSVHRGDPTSWTVPADQ